MIARSNEAKRSIIEMGASLFKFGRSKKAWDPSIFKQINDVW